MRSPTSGFRFPAAALLVAFGVSGAITIVPNYGTGFGPGTPQRAVFEDKIQRWANYPCLCHYTVNIDVSMADLGTFGELPVTYPKGVEYLMAPNPDNPAEWGTLGVTDNFQYNADGYPSGA
ncbi:hypothetical protein FJY70_01185, partial [candidate division WOR-3 bacterium]|nr:hypothetical protein [candidate division WOR-3 bacterium]